jgi:hypothetical protein
VEDGLRSRCSSSLYSLVKEHQDHDSGHPQLDRSCITGLREGDNHESPPGEFATGQFSAEPSRTQATMCQYSMQRAMGHASAFEPAGLGRIPYRRPEGGSTSVTVGVLVHLPARVRDSTLYGALSRD